MFYMMDVHSCSGNGALGLCLLALAQNCYAAASLVVPCRSQLWRLVLRGGFEFIRQQNFRALVL